MEPSIPKRNFFTLRRRANINFQKSSWVIFNLRENHLSNDLIVEEKEFFFKKNKMYDLSYILGVKFSINMGKNSNNSHPP